MPEHIDPAELSRLWDFTDLDGTRRRLEAAIASRGDALDAVLELRTQLARVLGLEGRFEEAHQLLDGLESDDPVVRTRIALERGRLYNSAGALESAIDQFRQAVDLAATAGTAALEVDALHMLAIADAERAESWAERGLAVAEASGDVQVRKWIGPLRNNLGWTLHDRGEFEGALAQFEAARECYEMNGTPPQVHVAWWSVARCLRSLGRFGEALAIQQRLKREGEPDPYVDEELAELERLMAGA